MKIEPLVFEEDSKFNNIYENQILTEVNIADIHFGAPGVNPEVHYNILYNQFIRKIYMINFDILIINGDLFDKRFPSSSDVIKYALMFVNDCICVCREKNASFIIINGTKSHDDGQLSLLYQYVNDPTIDIRIIESTQFVYVKGTKKLCIPEEYGKGKEYYEHFLYNSGIYDSVNLHGTIVGSIYGANDINLDTKKSPIFGLENFCNCRGPIIAGHVHTGGCFEKYMYYCSSPIRYKFGEEEPKGFIILLHNKLNHSHYVHFEEIISFKYDTIRLDALININYKDPNYLKSYIDNLISNGIDHIRLVFDNIPEETVILIKQAYATNSLVAFKEEKRQNIATSTIEEIEKKYEKLDFLLDNSLNEYDKLVRYINYNKGSEYITVDKLKEILG